MIKKIPFSAFSAAYNQGMKIKFNFGDKNNTILFVFVYGQSIYGGLNRFNEYKSYNLMPSKTHESINQKQTEDMRIWMLKNLPKQFIMDNELDWNFSIEKFLYKLKDAAGLSK